LRAAALLATIFAATSAAAAAGWTRAESSLLLKNHKGKVLHEVGLGSWDEELDESSSVRRTMDGGVCDDGRFAWHWQKAERVSTGADARVLTSSTTFVFLGSAGQMLWRSFRASAPDGVSPARISHDGMRVLLVEHSEEGYRAAVYAFTGNLIAASKAAQRLERAELTSNGDYALTLGGDVDEALVYTFFDLKRRRTRTMPAAEAPLGQADILEDGTVRLGGKPVFSMSDDL